MPETQKQAHPSKLEQVLVLASRVRASRGAKAIQQNNKNSKIQDNISSEFFMIIYNELNKSNLT